MLGNLNVGTIIRKAPRATPCSNLFFFILRNNSWSMLFVEKESKMPRLPAFVGASVLLFHKGMGSKGDDYRTMVLLKLSELGAAMGGLNGKQFIPISQIVC